MFSWIKIHLAESLMPVRGTETAGSVDHLYYFLLISSLISFILAIGGMTYFIVKYKRKTANDQTAYITHNNLLEFLWSFIPFVIFMVIFYWGWVIYDDLRYPPEDAEEIHVTASQWMWTVSYKNGYSFRSKNGTAQNPQGINVPANKPVKIVLASKDVIHSFFVPAFRTKQDAVPGRYTSVWFKAKEEGEYQVFCTEYCGLDHSNMPIKIVAMKPDAYSAWLAASTPKASEAGDASLAGRGKELYGEKNCIACHSVDGTRVVGPTLKGLFGAKRDFESGPSADADEAYLRESILNSQAKIVKTYPAAMPIYKGQLEEEEVTALIEYIKSLK